ncbi:MAG: c-type cytochrome [Alphaproteobacteria bacterium]|nr:c-type cytochrome [Alphaproteobacteria bacterium]
MRLLGGLTMVALLLASAGAMANDAVKRGAYLVHIMGCGDCHTPGYFLGKPDLAHPLSGSDVGFEIPGLGIFWGPNLTPDPETGLGKWSAADMITAIRTGVTPDGRKLAPIMPSANFATLTDADAQAVAAYLRSLPPTKHAVSGPTKPGETPAGPYFKIVVPQ